MKLLKLRTLFLSLLMLWAMSSYAGQTRVCKVSTNSEENTGICYEDIFGVLGCCKGVILCAFITSDLKCSGEVSVPDDSISPE